VVDVQVGAHHVVDVIVADAGGGKALFPALARLVVPEGPRRPRLVVANAAVDENLVVRRLDEEALEAQHHLARGIDVGGPQPAQVLLQHIAAERGEELEGVEQRRLAFHHRMDGDISDLERRHGSLLPALAARAC